MVSRHQNSQGEPGIGLGVDPGEGAPLKEVGEERLEARPECIQRPPKWLCSREEQESVGGRLADVEGFMPQERAGHGFLCLTKGSLLSE